MSLYGVLNSSVSGMAAQSNRIGAVADNISNSATTGYKRVGTEFETIMGLGDRRDYATGGVKTDYRHAIAEQGTLQSTSNPTDLAIQGNGFFLVARPDSAPALTRAGAFEPDAGGYLVNSAGYRLLGLDLSGGTSSIDAAGAQGMTPVRVDTRGLVATPSTSGELTVNLPSQATSLEAGALPSANAAGAAYTAKTSVIAYDNLGASVPLDVYFAKTGANAWEASVYRASDAASGGGFPYGASALATQALAFDPANGRLADGAGLLSLAIPNGSTLQLDLGKTTQLASPYALTASSMNGNAPSGFDHVEFGADGTLSTIYRNGARIDSFKVPIASVVATNGLRPMDGNAFAETAESGSVAIGTAGSANLGRIAGSTLENSTVDLASELTTMIQAQRSYTANSKAFQAGAEMLDIISNLKV